MARPAALVLAGLGLGVGLSACGGAAELAAPSPTMVPGMVASDDGVLGLAPGEALAFEVRMAGVLAGEAELVVGPPATEDGRDALAVRSVIRSAGAFALIKEVRDDVTSIVDLERMRPVRTTSDVIFGPKRYHAETEFSEHGAAIQYTPEGGTTRTIRYDFRDAVVHDAHSAMALVRTWTAAPGERIGLWVIGGRRIWRTEVWSVGSEVIGTRMGNQPALRIDGTSQRSLPDLSPDPAKPPRSFSVWLSDDADRVPLRFLARTELGEITIELVSYARP